MGIFSFLISKLGKNICNTDQPHEFYPSCKRQDLQTTVGWSPLNFFTLQYLEEKQIKSPFC